MTLTVAVMYDDPISSIWKSTVLKAAPCTKEWFLDGRPKSPLSSLAVVGRPYFLQSADTIVSASSKDFDPSGVSVVVPSSKCSVVASFDPWPGSVDTSLHSSHNLPISSLSNLSGSI